MFKRDQPEIGEFAMSSPDRMVRALTFVLLTIQQRLDTVPAMMKDIDRNGIESHHLWGFKAGAYSDIVERQGSIYRDALHIRSGFNSPDDTRNELLRYFASMQGFGLVKGGFAVQLLFGLSGCIDSHNLLMYEIPSSRVKASAYKAAKPQTQSKKLQEYHDLCDDIGGTEFLWDNWCRHVALRTNSIFETPDEVSRVHVTAIKGTRL